MAHDYSDVAITVAISEHKLDEIKAKFENVHYYPTGEFPDDLLAKIDIWYTSWLGLPTKVKDISQVPKTRIVQLSSAGANNFLGGELMSSDAARRQIMVCSSSGIHTLSIPQYVIANVVNLYMKLHAQFHLVRTQSRWPSRPEVVEAAGLAGVKQTGNRNLRGKTVGFLGYGHIAREAARLFQAFGCEIIAANTRGDQRPEEGYAIPGTGDADGSIPSAYYATSDAASFKTFLGRCDVLVASLPSTPYTQYMLTAELLGCLPEGAVFVNVGRGDLVRSEDVLSALNAPKGVEGVALDVTDPEPLPDGHPLFAHPRAIITPHTSGSFEGYFDSGADVLLFQADRIKEGKQPVNIVDPVKGY